MNRAILVKSCQKFRKRREACERTWAGALARDTIQKDGVDVWFAQGGQFDEIRCDVSVSPECLPQTRRLGCGTIITSFGEAYSDNSIKLRRALKTLLASPFVFDSIFICDDDTFVHPQRWLAHEPQGDLECRVFRPDVFERRRPELYQWIHGGPGWWMSRRLCELYVEHATERTSADDMLVARIAQQHGIEMWDRPDLYGGDRYSGHDPPERVSADNKLISCHHVQPEEMVRLWEATRAL